MKKFGELKTKILKRITELYNNGEKGEVKKIFSLIMEDENFKKLYLFYDNFEKKFIDDVDVVDEYLNEVSIELKTLRTDIHETFNKIESLVGEVEIIPNVIYENLDILSERRKLSNIEDKVVAKKILKEHLIFEKEDNSVDSFTLNENLLHTVMTNNFNLLYSNLLSEEEQTELQGILKMSTEELSNSIGELKEEILTNVETLLSENKSPELTEKLNNVKTELDDIQPTKYNYFRIKTLKDNLL